MARHKQPRELAELKGAHKHDPQRYKNTPPKNKHGLGDPPAHMEEKAKEIWYELLSHALPGVLTASERFVFEILSNLMAEYRADPKGFATMKYSTMIGCLAKLGLSPTDRQKLGVTKDDKPANEFEDF